MKKMFKHLILILSATFAICLATQSYGATNLRKILSCADPTYKRNYIRIDQNQTNTFISVAGFKLVQPNQKFELADFDNIPIRLSGHTVQGTLFYFVFKNRNCQVLENPVSIQCNSDPNTNGRILALHRIKDIDEIVALITSYSGYYTKVTADSTNGAVVTKTNRVDSTAEQLTVNLGSKLSNCNLNDGDELPSPDQRLIDYVQRTNQP